MSDCIFCKIVAGEIPATKIYEDDDVYAFLDAKPVNVGHTLVVPKKHAEDLLAMNEDEVGRLFAKVRRIAKVAYDAVEADGFNIGVNTKPAAGQLVFHAHVHVMPRFDDDGLKHWPKKDVPEERSLDAAAKMRAALAG